MADYSKPLPYPSPATQPFWDACKRHELSLPYCPSCEAFFFYPRAFCPRCFWIHSLSRLRSLGLVERFFSSGAEVLL